jgi:hypothetical protein
MPQRGRGGNKAVAAARNKTVNPSVCHLVAETNVEADEVGAAPGKPHDPEVRHFVAFVEVEVGEVGAATGNTP